MTRVLFEAKRRLPAPAARSGVIVVEPPPELPRLVPPSLMRRAMPWVIGLLVVGMIVALFATGMRLITPQTLFFPFVLLLAATGIFRGSNSGTPVAEVDEERADYLRYLARVRGEARSAAAAQRAALEWSHPAPDGLAPVAGTRRQWERDPGDADFLAVRVGLGDVPAAATLRVGESGEETDLEPVCQTSLAALLDAHRDLAEAPVTVDLAATREIVVHGDADEAREAIAAWIAAATTWHDPAVLTLAAASPELDSPAWTWLKWLPHTDIPGKADGLGPARRLAADPAALPGLVADMLHGRPPRAAQKNAAQSAAFGHLMVVVDDPAWRPETLLPAEGLAGVVVVRRSERAPDLDELDDPARLVLKVEGGALQRWERGAWRGFAAQADALGAAEAAHLARQLARWNSGPVASDSRGAGGHVSGFPALLGIKDAADLDVTSLWASRPRDRELRVPIGVTSTGEPLYFDLKDEAEGGMGPHGLMIGMTGSGKSQTIMAILLSLLTTHPADRLIVIYLDFKGEAGADIFRDFPQVVAVISNMAEKRSLADRFADTLRGEIARREQLLREAGRRVQGSAFNSVAEYENAIAHGHDLPPIPTLFVVADEFTLMLAEHPEYAELFDHVARKGRSLRVHILFASQTLDIGRIKDIDKNTSYRIGLKVASAAASRQVIGVEDAYHIESGKEHKGVGYFVPSPGAIPVKFRASYVDGVYEPPRAATVTAPYAVAEPKRFTAAFAQPDQAEVPATVEDIAPITKARKLISVIGEQLAELGPKAPELWLAPLDTPISLGGLLERVPAEPLRWPIGEIDRPFLMRRDPLVFDAASAAGNIAIHGGPKSGKSSALMTVVLSASATCSPEDVQFHVLDYGGGRLAALAPLPHVAAVASPHDEELVRRVLAELRQLLGSRQRLFRDHSVASIEQFRERRASEAALRDGFGDVFLLLDDLTAFSRANTDQFTTKNPLLAEISELATSGLAYGIHVLVTTANWLDVPLAMRDGLGMRLELRLTDPRDSNVRDPEALRKPAESVPADQPGRGLTMAAEHFLIAAPRLDTADTAEGLAAATAESARQLAARYQGLAAPKVRVLPVSLDPREIEPVLPRRDLVVVGLREEDLAPAAVDFAANPLLLVLGDSGAGKTTLLRHVIRSVRDNSTAEEVAFTVVDRRLRLVDEPLFPDNEHTTHLDRVIPAMLGLTALMERRRPPAGLSAQQLRDWTFPATALDPGQTHYLIIDDADQIPDAPAFSGPHIGQRPWAGIVSVLASAADLGLRVIVTARAAGSGHTVMTNSLLRSLVDLQATTLMLSGNPHDSGKIRGHRFSRLPPGRAVLVGDDDVPAFIQLANAQSTENRKEGRR
ncbi:type VII secretion protein EccC [Segniliparus rugosus]|uniref:Type VII secretion protein EccCa n=1 Tax=Segniliparus rugosus (strain ATCC BAA-974 / DSM 45345 / CCUG 50838 / CIP 108380 / JCM 13579 / CDC 945) TaxID=679197 RepID=E5XLT5_SEGRC|nr:type VII secretion protein EccC [Segniliparus rugosus]EFV14687.2 type VII secretion protein EccCa [Segniliparus rugosus ATCC BAA-974]